MLKQALQIIENMPQDENTLALKNIINSILDSSRIYMLYYNGKPLRFYTQTNYGDFCNEISYYLTRDEDYPIWTTTDVRIAAYNKYISTPWYNSDYNQTTHDGHMNPEDIQIIDNYGNVYNRKPLKFKTYAVIEAELFGDDDGLHRIKNWNNIDWDNQYLSIYQQTTYLDEVKDRLKRRAGKVPIKGMSLSSLYSYRKDLVTVKGELLKAGKPFDKIQKKLNSVNKKIIKLGGR